MDIIGVYIVSNDNIQGNDSVRCMQLYNRNNSNI